MQVGYYDHSEPVRFETNSFKLLTFISAVANSTGSLAANGKIHANYCCKLLSFYNDIPNKMHLTEWHFIYCIYCNGYAVSHAKHGHNSIITLTEHYGVPMCTTEMKLQQN